MSDASSGGVLPSPRAYDRTQVEWVELVGVLGLAIALRLLFYNGAFGSDDNVYLARALDVATGTWSSANYNGALRYGFNLPAGLLLALFGTNSFTVNLWPLLCSVGEVALVYYFARQNFGRFAGLWAGLLLGLAPLHVAVATRIHADPVAAFFLTAAFVSGFEALQRRSLWACAVCGLMLGAVFWTKELAAVVFITFVPLLWYFRRFGRGLLIALAALAVMLALHGWLMWIIAGDPLHAVKVVLMAMKRNFIDEGAGEDGPWYYFRYLAFDVRHVGLLAWLALWGLATLWWKPRQGQTSGGLAPSPGLFAAWWLIGLLAVLSFFPVSLSPLRFTMKQSNYITLFLAPLALIAAIGVSRISAVVRWLPLAATVLVSLLLSALQQADYRSYTGASKAVHRAYAGHSDLLLVGSSNLAGIAPVLRFLGDAPVAVTSFRDVLERPAAEWTTVSRVKQVLAVMDPQTVQRSAGGRAVERPQPCWVFEASVPPIDLGLGNTVAGALRSIARLAPASVSVRLDQALGKLSEPAPASVYRVPGADLWCGRDGPV